VAVGLLEARFQHKVLADLRKTKGLFVFTKEALSLRGLPDLIGCFQGRFFGWELKKDEASTRRTTGRTVLQRHILSLIVRAGGVGEFVCPENYQEKKAELLKAHLE